MRGAALASVVVGGMVGAAAREALTLAAPGAWTIMAINVVGAFCLGLVLARLARKGPDEGRRRLVRLGLGTGVLGGFTTYSALAYGIAGLQADWLVAGVLTLALGPPAAALGMVLAGRDAS